MDCVIERDTFRHYNEQDAREKADNAHNAIKAKHFDKYMADADFYGAMGYEQDDGARVQELYAAIQWGDSARAKVIAGAIMHDAARQYAEHMADKEIKGLLDEDGTVYERSVYY